MSNLKSNYVLKLCGNTLMLSQYDVSVLMICVFMTDLIICVFMSDATGNKLIVFAMTCI